MCCVASQHPLTCSAVSLIVQLTPANSNATASVPRLSPSSLGQKRGITEPWIQKDTVDEDLGPCSLRAAPPDCCTSQKRLLVGFWWTHFGATPQQTRGRVSAVFQAALQRQLGPKLRLELGRAWERQLLLELSREEGKGWLEGIQGHDPEDLPPWSSPHRNRELPQHGSLQVHAPARGEEFALLRGNNEG